MQTYYAADLLYVLSTCFVKLSLIVFIDNIAVDEFHKRVILALGTLTASSTVAALFAAAFQCGAAKAWEVMKLHCFDQVRVFSPKQ